MTSLFSGLQSALGFGGSGGSTKTAASTTTTASDQQDDSGSKAGKLRQWNFGGLNLTEDQDYGPEQFYWSSVNRPALMLRCPESQWWSIFKEQIACGSYGCLFRVDNVENAQELAQKIAAQGGIVNLVDPDLDWSALVLKITSSDQFLKPSTGPAKNITEKRKVEAVVQAHTMLWDLEQELVLSTMMGQLGIGPKMYTFHVDVGCDDYRESRKYNMNRDWDKPDFKEIKNGKELVAVRSATAYISERLETDLGDFLIDMGGPERQQLFLDTFAGGKIGPAAGDALISLVRKILHLFKELYTRGYIHHDQRWHLGNIMVNKAFEPRLIDFGLSEYYGDALSSATDLILKSSLRTSSGTVHSGDSFSASLDEVSTTREIDELLASVPADIQKKLETPQIDHDKIQVVEAKDVDPYYSARYFKAKLLRQKLDQALELRKTLEMVIPQKLKVVIGKEQLANAVRMQRKIESLQGNFTADDYYNDEQASVKFFTTLMKLSAPFVKKLVDGHVDVLQETAEFLDAIALVAIRTPTKTSVLEIDTPFVCTYSPRLEAYWEIVCFVVRLNASSDHSNLLQLYWRLTHSAATPMPVPGTLAKQLLDEDPQRFRQLVDAMFGGVQHTMPYAEMFVAALSLWGGIQPALRQAKYPKFKPTAASTVVAATTTMDKESTADLTVSRRNPKEGPRRAQAKKKKQR